MPLPLVQDLVLVGGGHTHALVLKSWGMRPVPGARLTVINPAPTAPYTGMLPGFVAGHYNRDALEIDLVKLARFAGARLILGYADGIDREAKTIHITGRGDIAYDLASVDVGITTAMPDLPGFPEHGVPAKPLGIFADRWAAYLNEDGPAEIAVIGAGVGGAELAMAMSHALSERGRTAQITLIEAQEPLPGVASGTKAAVLKRLGALGIALLEGVTVARVNANSVALSDGREVPATLTVGTAGARPWDWLSGTGLAHTDGFLDVDDRLRTSDPSLFATGDSANLTASPRPKAGVYAVRAAPVLTQNLRAALSGGALKAFRPQSDFLKLISLGGQEAVGEKWGLSWQAPWVWRAKNWIDQSFMDRLATFPDMPRLQIPQDAAKGLRREVTASKPLCGGCGAKVGPNALAQALASDLPTREDVTHLKGDDAALIEERQVISTDHLRAVTDDPYLMAKIAAVHALGDIWAMGATPQAALATIILPKMSETLQTRWTQEIMAGAAEIFGAAGAAIAGGHTSLGAELTIGFTVTGLAHPPIARAGAKPGDALVLTRPLGSGVVLAGEMALKAPGDTVAAVLAEMARPQIEAANALKQAHAMTDVTGFGLAGHLLGICHASGVGARLNLDAIPLYDGALVLSKAGIRSTIAPANRTHAEPHMDLPDDPRADLLFDPQTCGGLLAAVPQDAVPADLPIIGKITDGPARITVT